MTISLTKLYSLLSDKLGKPEAETLTTYIEEKINDEFERNKSSIVSDLKSEIEKTKSSLLWAMIALFIPLYVTLTIAIINLLK